MSEEKIKAGEAAGTATGHGVPLPQVDFSTFILSMASSAMVCLGEAPDPASGKSEVNLALAKYNIDLLDLLRNKTLNGLDEAETRLLEGVLYELRLKYVIKAG